MSVSPRLLLLALLGTLTACGGGGGGSDNDDTPPDNSGGDQGSYTAYACSAPVYNQADGLRIYEVMTEAFIDGDTNANYGTAYGPSAHNGDIQGIIDSLDYIKSLGMNAIWVTPIFASVAESGQDEWADRLDGTGYYTSNYFAIDPKFGTMEQARELVEKAHQKGLYVFFDGVFGHFKENANDYPANDGLTVSTNGNDAGTTGREAVYPQDLDFFKEVASYWVNELKIDGWRLDQAYQVPTGAWGEIRQAVEQASSAVSYTNSDGNTVHPLGYMVAEIWDSTSNIVANGYGTSDEPGICSAFAFPLRYSLVETFGINEGGNNGSGGATLNAGLAGQAAYPSWAKPNLMLGNHDLVRFGDLLQRGNLADVDQAGYWARHRAALSFLAAYSGPITLYYGEEIGDELPGFAAQVDCSSDGGASTRQGLCDDHVSRTDGKIPGLPTGASRDIFTPSAQQQALHDYTASLMALRAEHPALSQGTRTNVVATTNAFVDYKKDQDDVLLYMVSTTATEQTLSLSEAQTGSEGTLTDLLTGETFNPAGGYYDIPLSAFQARFLSIDTPSDSGPVADENNGEYGTGFMATCDNPDASGTGPIAEALYLTGDFSDSNWSFASSRQLHYKGDNVYQAVVDETAGSFNFQFATEDWDPQFSNSGLVTLGNEVPLAQGGYDMNTSVAITTADKYVYSVKVTDSGEPSTMMVSRCAP